MAALKDLARQFARDGRVEAIFLRPGRDVPALSVDWAVALADRGLEGDRSARIRTPPAGGGKRQVTLLQSEHVPLIAAWVARADVDPAILRRNVVIAGINLLAANALFADLQVGIAIGRDVVLVTTGPCAPCSRMEAALGPGGYNAMRGHGGLTARIATGGRIAVGDPVRVVVVEQSRLGG